MPVCDQCGTRFSSWAGDHKRLCPQCEERQEAASRPEVLPPEGAGQPPQPQVQLPPPTVSRILIALNIMVFAAMVISTRSILNFSGEDSIRWGANFGPYTVDGQWWRMLVATFLHGGIAHILLNMWALRNIGYTAELFYGHRNYLIIYLLSGLGGSAASLLRGQAPSVGASGAIFGVAGALAALVYFKKLPVERAILRREIGSIGMFIVANLLISSFVPHIDNSAHVGGLIAGTILGMFLPAAIFRAEREKPATSGNLAIVTTCALIVFLAFVAREKQLPRISIRYAAEAERRGDLAGAQAHARKAVELAPADPLANYALCAMLVQRSSAEAVEACEKAVQLNPRSMTSQLALAEAYNNTGQKDAAVKTLQQLLERNPRSFEANYNLGLLFLNQGKPGEAVPYLREATRLKPDDADARQSLAEAQAKFGK